MCILPAKYKFLKYGNFINIGISKICELNEKIWVEDYIQILHRAGETDAKRFFSETEQ